jgi:hypothetical protein
MHKSKAPPEGNVACNMALCSHFSERRLYRPKHTGISPIISQANGELGALTAATTIQTPKPINPTEIKLVHVSRPQKVESIFSKDQC